MGLARDRLLYDLLGRLSREISSPIESLPGSASSARPSSRFRAWRTAATIPMLTEGSPFSILASVGRLVAALSATIFIVRFRRNLAVLISSPSFRMVRRVPGGGL